MVLRRLGPLSCARFTATTYACLAFLGACVWAAILLIGGLSAFDYGWRNPVLGQAILYGYWGLLLAPLLYGLFGFIVGYVGAVFFNVFARLVGGIEMDVSLQPEKAAS